jgi:trimeric autotransporter adhesin
MKKETFLFLLAGMACTGLYGQNVWSVNGGFNANGTTNLKLQTNGTDRVTVLNVDGKVGIGTTTPTEMLDVNGTLRLRLVTQNNTFNQILVNDGTGKIFWRDVSSITATVSNIPFTLTSSSIGVGTDALINNSATGNTALGFEALFSNTSGPNGNIFNTAVGYKALHTNNGSPMAYTSAWNTAVGANALLSNSTGYDNSAVGTYSLMNNSTGNANTASGVLALQNNSTGSNNTAFGQSALSTNTIGNNNTAIGKGAGPTINNLSNTTAIGNGAVPTASNQVRIGDTNVTSIGGQVSWTTFSDGRFKVNVKEDVSGLEFINMLRPVSYSLDKDRINSFLGVKTQPDLSENLSLNEKRQTGFIAQEVEEVIKRSGFVFHGIEAPQNEKDHYSIRYAEFVVPLVKAVQELSAKVEEQQRQIDMLSRQGAHSNGSADEETQNLLVLYQNNPNPFHRDTEIRMNIPGTVHQATLFIYDMSGKQIDKRVINQRGLVISELEGGRLRSGMYYYTLVADNVASDAKKMILTE